MADKRLSVLFKMAALNGVNTAVRHFLRRGEDVNAADDSGRSPLILAASRGYLETCKLLLEAGANPGHVDNEGNDAAGVALARGRDEVARFIREYTPSPMDLRTAQVTSNVVSAAVSPPDISSSLHQAEPPCLDFSALFAGTYSARDAMATEAGAEPTSVRSDDAFRLEPQPDFLDGDRFVWEEYEDVTLAEGDASCGEIAADLQRAISLHIPVDTDADWADVKVELPEIPDAIVSLAGIEETDLLKIRNLLAEAIQSGSIAYRRVVRVIGDINREWLELESAVLRVLEAMGVELDERTCEDLRVPDGAMSDDLDEVLDEAMTCHGTHGAIDDSSGGPGHFQGGFDESNRYKNKGRIV